MTYHEGQAVLYKPLKSVAYIRRVNNRPEVSETQRNYQVEVNGYLVTVMPIRKRNTWHPHRQKPARQFGGPEFWTG